MANRTFELSLNSLAVKETGSKRKKGQHMVIATLVWPRPLIAERVSTKTFSFHENLVDLKKADWITRIMFKERIEGTFGIELGITERMSDSEITDFLRFLGSSLTKMLGNEAEDAMVSAIAGGLVKVPFTFLSKFISNLGDKGPKIIAGGSIVLHSEDTWKSPSRKSSSAKGKNNESTKTFKVPLTAPQTLYKVVPGRRSGGRQAHRKTLMDAGAKNGMIEFTGKVYG